MKQIGTVKWFNAAKGFGFLTAPGLKEDVFVHHAHIVMDGYRVLKAQETVEFTLQQGKNGLSAAEVVRRPPADRRSRY